MKEEDLVGKRLSEIDLFMVRVVREDNNFYCIDALYMPDRINVEIQNEIITKAWRG